MLRQTYEEYPESDAIRERKREREKCTVTSEMVKI
jgi:hypothetical protein